MTTYDEAVARAREIGREHGENAAAAWWADYSPAAGKVIVSRMAAQTSVQETFGGHLPAPDLSGEWADGYTPRNLVNDSGWIDAEPDGDTDPAGWATWQDAETDLCDAYESAFSEAVETAVRAACENALSA